MIFGAVLLVWGFMEVLSWYDFNQRVKRKREEERSRYP